MKDNWERFTILLISILGLVGLVQSVSAQHAIDYTETTEIVFPYHDEKPIDNDAEEAMSMALVRTPFKPVDDQKWYVLDVETSTDWIRAYVLLAGASLQMKPASDPLTILIRQTDDGWQAASEYDEVWIDWLQIAPESIMSDSWKTHLLQNTNDVSGGASPLAILFFPWRCDETARVTQGPHADYAIDWFLNQGDTLASSNGTITFARWASNTQCRYDSGDTRWEYPTNFPNGSECLWTEANYMMLQDDTGRYQYYLHFSHDTVDDKWRTGLPKGVDHGEFLAVQGNTGWTGPFGNGTHLHFGRWNSGISGYENITFQNGISASSIQYGDIHTSQNCTADTTPPITSHSLSGTSGNNGWYISNVQVTLTANEPVNWTKYNLNSAGWVTYSGPFSVTTEQQNSLQYYSEDIGGNQESLKSVVIKIDKTTPETIDSLSGTSGNNGWYLSNVSIVLNATDNVSGVKSVQYKIGDGAWQTHNGSSVTFNVTSEGSTTVYYKAEDNAGNVETEKSVVIKIDKAEPSSACVPYASGSNGWYSGDVTVTCSGNDATSGLDHIDYDVDSGGSQEYSGSFVVSGEGNHDIVHTATDVAGNVESDQTVAFGIDLTPPTVLTMTLNNGSSTSYNSTVIVSSGVSDNLSGVAEMCVSYNQVAWDCAAYSSSFLYSLPAINQSDVTVYFYVIDQAGNESSIANETITLDFYPDLPSSLNYRLCSTVVDSAGGSSGSTNFHVDSAVGQPSEGVSNSDSFQLSSGFMARGADCGTSIIPTYGYEMVQDVIAASGEVKTSGSFTLVSTFGETAASPCTASTSYQLSSGFWGGCQQQAVIPNSEVFLPVVIK